MNGGVDSHAGSHHQDMSSTSNIDNGDKTQQQLDEEAKKKRNGPKRRKVTHACVYCRRSHMTCDDGELDKQKISARFHLLDRK
ncbi:hypothetical protein EDD11_001063 [Mortierella claussenii]|nr:hypothetical protein EDD11_001063 [Mortierella claussenii]